MTDPLQPPLTRNARILRAVVVAATLAYVIAAICFRMSGSLGELSIQGDQHQSIGHYWRYAVDGAIPPGHLLGDYAFAYHAPPLWWIVMAMGSALFGPLVTTKILHVFAYLAYAASAALLVGRRTHWFLGCLAAALVMRNGPDMPEQITGGMARSLSPALLCLFLWAFMEQRHRLALVLLVLQAGIYPSIVIPCGIAYGAYCVLAGPTMRVRLRRCAGMFVAGLLIIVLGKWQDLKSPEWWGPPVTYEQAEKMPAWRAGGRFPEVPHRSLDSIMSHNLVRPYKPLGHQLLDDATNKAVNRNMIDIFIKAPPVLALVAFVAAMVLRLRRRRRELAAEVVARAAFARRVEAAAELARAQEAAAAADPEQATTTATTTPSAPLVFEAPAAPPAPSGPRPMFPWHFLWVAAASFASYGLVRLLAFKLFLPSRQIGFTIQYLVLLGMPLLVWYGVAWLFPRRRALAVAITALVTIVPAFLFRGDGLATSGAGYRDHRPDAKIYKALRALPLDEEIGCDVNFCEFIIPLAQHVPFVSRNLAHPLRAGYYAETERRMVAMHRVLYATSVAETNAFYEKEKVRYFVYAKNRLTAPAKIFNPIDAQVKKLFDRAGKKPKLLENPNKEAIVLREGNRFIIDITKLKDPPPPPPPAEPAPVIGPAPKP
ncbi:MAG: hypothetical protein Q8O67_13275 [Deltaproteobacteria bacterium]|nr:hypothetical protein [Deltaproteobacteria bacterium]